MKPSLQSSRTPPLSLVICGDAVAGVHFGEQGDYPGDWAHSALLLADGTADRVRLTTIPECPAPLLGAQTELVAHSAEFFAGHGFLRVAAPTYRPKTSRWRQKVVFAPRARRGKNHAPASQGFNLKSQSEIEPLRAQGNFRLRN